MQPQPQRTFVRECQRAVHALACSSPVPDEAWCLAPGDGVVRLVSWPDPDVCHAVELCWAMTVDQGACGIAVYWHGTHSLQHVRRCDQKVDAGGGLGVYRAAAAAPAQTCDGRASPAKGGDWHVNRPTRPAAAAAVTPRRVTAMLVDFALKLPGLLAKMRRSWWVADARQVLVWPYTVPPQCCCDTAAPLVMPAVLGRVHVARHRDTHTLLLHEAGRNSQFDVFWRRLVNWRADEKKTAWHFGRVQYNVFYALVPRQELRDFQHITGIVL